MKNRPEAVGAEIPDDLESLSIKKELEQIRNDLYNLSNKSRNVTSYHQEIDYALERIAAIERHLGIDRKMAA